MCCNILKLQPEIEMLEEAGSDFFHIDVMDGHFVNNFAMNGYEIKQIKEVTDVPLDLHLMIENPGRYVGYFAEAGADIINVHLETCVHINRTLQKIKEYGLKAGVAINPGTSHLLLEPILDYLDYITIMAVNPGFAGQKFIPATVKKVESLHKLLKRNGFTDIEIEVDGNIYIDTIPPLYSAGANIFVAGTSGLFYGDMNYKENIARLRDCIKVV